MIVSSARARLELGWEPRCRRAIDVVEKHLGEVPGRVDARIATFLRMLPVAARRALEGEAADGGPNRIHLQLLGPNGGDFGIMVQQGQLGVQRGIPRPPTAVLSLSSHDFLDLLAGRTDVPELERAGGLQVEGDPHAAWILDSIVSRFRHVTCRSGPRGEVARWMSRWFTRGVSA